MNNRILNTIIFFLIINIDCFSQSEYPFYEQLAFNFYKDTILEIYPVERKIIVFKSLNYDSGEEIYYVPSDCLKTKLPNYGKNIEKLKYSKYWRRFEDMRLDLDLTNIDKKKFKIRKFNRGNFPKLFVHYPKVYENRIFVIVHEKYQNCGKYYTVELNKAGEIIDWCQSKYETVTLH